ncbi:MAG: hypothetical protein IPL32_14820 [Chloracidobacterium sp.]|nr:hypothetical protein [Chloracidobacterium sp.]
MYKNRLSRKTPNITPNSHPHLFIPRSGIEFASVDRIESVCAILIEGRFGPDFVYQVMENPTDRPELDPKVFYDLSDDCEVTRPNDLSHRGRNDYQAVETAYRRARQIALAATTANGNNLTDASSNQGRGSP